MPKSFDVFLSHNSKDKSAVRALAEALRAQGLKVWLDEWELVPGQPWQEALEEVIETCLSSAVLVGKDGLGPWQDQEMRGCLSEFVERKLPVIPVLLPGAPEVPRLPFFLKRFTWVDLRGGLTEEGIDRLQWGATGKRPDRSKPPPAAGAVPEELAATKTALAEAPPTRSIIPGMEVQRTAASVAVPGLQDLFPVHAQSDTSADAAETTYEQVMTTVRSDIDILEEYGDVRVALTTTLGIEVIIDLFDIEVTDPFLKAFIANNLPRSMGLPIRASEAVGFVLYFDSFKDLQAVGNAHVMTFESGQRMGGKIPARLVTSGMGSERRTYDLGDVATLRLLGLGKNWFASDDSPFDQASNPLWNNQNDRWILSVGTDVDYTVSGPHFLLEHQGPAPKPWESWYGRPRYKWFYWNQYHPNRALSVRIRGTSHVVNIGDLTHVQFEKSGRISLGIASGKEIAGEFVGIWTKEDDLPPQRTEPVLAAYVDGHDRLIIVVTAANWTLRKVSTE